MFVCLWNGRLRWLGLPLAAAVALWPRGEPPVAWIASDGDDAAIVVGRQEIPLRPTVRQYATQLWAQRRGFTLPADPTPGQQALFDCDRKHCTPKAGTAPALSGWWSTRQPKPGDLDALCRASDDLGYPRGGRAAGVMRDVLVLRTCRFRAGRGR